MTNNSNKIQQDAQDDLQKANQLLTDVKKMNADFTQKTDKLIKDIDQELDDVEKEINKADEELKEFEKDAVDEIDKTVLEFASDEDEIEE